MAAYTTTRVTGRTFSCVLRSCHYGFVRLYGHAYQLERKLHGEGGRRGRGVKKMARKQEREREHRQNSASGKYCRANVSLSLN